MGKRRQNKESESKRKRLKQQQDAQLSTGLFSNNNEPEEIEKRNWDNEEQDYELKPRSQRNDN